MIAAKARLLYFAYGSNMYTPRLRYRVLSAVPVGIGVLTDHTLRWHKRSKDGSGKCDAVAAAGATVFGVLFTFDASEKGALDSAEAVGYGYNQRDVDVLLDGKPTRAFTYLADTRYINAALRPYTWYRDFVVAGTREHRLPDSYLAAIEGQVALVDPDPNRERQERSKVHLKQRGHREGL